MSSVLSKNQVNVLSLLSAEKLVVDSFYLSGGTALAEFYLQHRLSEDLDFFSEKEFDPLLISSVFKKIQNKAGIKKVNFEQSFNRNLFFLELQNDTIKTEFTYFPFTRIESNRKFGNLHIDSLIDIAVNKIFKIYQKFPYLKPLKKKIVDFDIPDTFLRGDPKLIELIKTKMQENFPERIK